MPKKGTPTGSRRRINDADREQILSLHDQGVATTDISRQLDIHGHVVNGVIRTAKQRGGTGIQPASRPPQAETPPMSERPNVAPSTAPMQPVPQPSGYQPSDGFSGGRSVMGGSGGFNHTSSAVKYTVERTVPPDGLLGTHYGSFSVDELGRIYGSGTYKVTKHEPGRAMPTEYIQVVSPAFGEPKFPNASGSPSDRRSRTWRSAWNQDRSQERTGDDDEERTRQRPYWWGQYYNRERERSYGEGEGQSRLYDFARHASSASESAMTKMVDQMDRMHQRSMEELKDARKGGPDNFIRDFFEKQQATMNQRFEEERKLADERRRQEEEKWERRRREEQEAWQRRQDEDERKHQRELERIKAETEARLREKDREEERRAKKEAEERKFLLDLEEKRLKIVQSEAQAQRERLESQLKEMQATVEKAHESAGEYISESTQKMDERFKERAEQLEREHKLREKHLDTEHKLQERFLDLKRESLESSGGDQLFSTINTVIKEFSKGLEKIVDLKKIEAMTPEAQAAAVAKGSLDGNVLEGAPGQGEPQRGAAPGRQAEVQGAQQPSGNGGGSHAAAHQGASAAQQAESAETKMDSIIQQNLKNPVFREVISEWALHVESESDATTFANLYLEMMRDPQNDEGRKACAAFATYMKPRNWKKMFAALSPHLDKDVVEIFKRPHAEDFYEAFRAMVIEQIRDYWEQFIAARKAQQEASAKGGRPAPAVPPGAEPEEGVPVPTRESLRSQLEGGD